MLIRTLGIKQTKQNRDAGLPGWPYNTHAAEDDLNSRSSWLHLPSAAKITTGVYHHARFLFGDGTQVLSMLGKTLPTELHPSPFV